MKIGELKSMVNQRFYDRSDYMMYPVSNGYNYQTQGMMRRSTPLTTGQTQISQPTTPTIPAPAATTPAKK